MASPVTPGHSRGPSEIDTTFEDSTTDRRMSRASINTPSTPFRRSTNSSDHNADEMMFSSGGPGALPNGLGNLADELGQAWEEDEDEGEEPDMNFQSAPEAEHESPVQRTPESLTLPKPKHKRELSVHTDYDGSEYGSESDMDSPGMPPGLVARMDMVESLARRGTEESGTERDGVVKRVVDELKELGSQSGVEGGASRLITAHTALSAHLLHQTRLLQSLAHPLFSPLSLPPDAETIEDLLPLLLSISDSMPRPTTAAFNSLTQLHSLTADLVQTLNYLSDTLHMSRQTTTTATRRLKSARELVAEMKRDEDAREEGERWLSKGNWGDRLAGREAAGVCKGVVGGFEEVCEGWRARLMAQAETVGA